MLSVNTNVFVFIIICGFVFASAFFIGLFFLSKKLFGQRSNLDNKVILKSDAVSYLLRIILIIQVATLFMTLPTPLSLFTWMAFGPLVETMLVVLKFSPIFIVGSLILSFVSHKRETDKKLVKASVVSSFILIIEWYIYFIIGLR